MGRHPGNPGWGRMNSLVVAVVMLLSVLFAAGSLYVAILKLRQQAWSDAAIWIFAPLVVFRLETVDRHHHIELLKLFPGARYNAERTRDDLCVNAAAFDLRPGAP